MLNLVQRLGVEAAFRYSDWVRAGRFGVRSTAGETDFLFSIPVQSGPGFPEVKWPWRG
jgi:hypothetical protein